MKSDLSKAIIVLQARKQTIERVIKGAEGIEIPAVKELQEEKLSINAALLFLENANKKPAKVRV
jgi:hypothetical protein